MLDSESNKKHVIPTGLLVWKAAHLTLYFYAARENMPHDWSAPSAIRIR